MARRWSALALGAALAAVAVAGPASGAGDQLTSTWAQLNVCNPAQLGARAQLAGDGSSTEMAVRFTAQWLSPDGWVPLSGKSTSPWQNAGSAEFTWQQAGWTFSLNVPQGGEAYQLRAVADMRLGSGRTAQYTTGTCTVGG
jgi:ABC-type phosphate transport system substrate-binding protein